MTTIDDIIENFSLLDDWEDRYRYVIELGKMLEPLPDALKNDQNKVSGCASQRHTSEEPHRFCPPETGKHSAPVMVIAASRAKLSKGLTRPAC